MSQPEFGDSLETGDRVLLYDGNCFLINKKYVCLGGATVKEYDENKYRTDDKDWRFFYKKRLVVPDNEVRFHPSMEPGSERLDFIKWPANCVRKMTEEEKLKYPPNPRKVNRGKEWQHRFIEGDVVILYSAKGADVLPEKYWDHSRWHGMEFCNKTYIADSDETLPHKVVGYAVIVSKVNQFWYKVRRIGKDFPEVDENGKVINYIENEIKEKWYIANMEVAVDRDTLMPLFV